LVRLAGLRALEAFDNLPDFFFVVIGQILLLILGVDCNRRHGVRLDPQIVEQPGGPIDV